MKKKILINTCSDGTAFAVKASYFKNASLATLVHGGGHFPCTGILEVYENKDDTDEG